MRARIIWSGALGLLFGGCQVQHTTVLEQSASGGAAGYPMPPPAAYRPMPPPQSPCAAPAGTGPFEHLSKPVSSASIPMPPRALAEHVDGCAGVMFRIGADGAPRDITVEAEYPLGYGFGDMGRQVISSSRWTPRNDLAWRYLVLNLRPRQTPS